MGVKVSKKLLIWPILAFISIIIYTLLPEAVIADSNKNSKTNTNQEELANETIALQNELSKSMILVQESSILAQNNPETTVSEKPNITALAVVVSKPKPVTKRWVIVTAYSSTVDQTDSTPFITASGTHVHDGTIAANFLKFGTKVRFPSLYGDKIFIVEDRMKSNVKADIWFPTRQEAKNFGVKWLEMEILD